MLDSENEIFDESKEYLRPEVIPSKEIVRILIILAIIASISGFIILLSIIAVSLSNSSIIYPYGFLLGFLLLSGGIILLSGLIFLNQESKKTTGIISSKINDNKPPN